jgi:hypothetical protein
MRCRWVCLLTCLAIVLVPGMIRATDVDGPDGHYDFYDLDDAPRGIPAYPDGTIGRFPRVYHVNNYDAWNLWLGGYPTNGPINGVVYGVDSDGGQHPLPHCIETAFGMTFPQDECVQDSTDMCLRSPVILNPCETTSFRIGYFVRVAGGILGSGCGECAILNILIDFNGDGDFGDVMFCETTQDSIPEWAVKNFRIPLTFSFRVEELDVPAFRVGPRTGPAWMRITLNSGYPSVPDDFAVAGSGEYGLYGGETEDYPLVIDGPVPITRTSWGLLKSRYR